MYSVRFNEIIGELEIVKEKMLKEFKCTLKSYDMKLLHYHVWDSNATLSKLFTFLQKLKEQFNYIIQDYVVSNTSLEHVFASYTNQDFCSEQSVPWWGERLL